MKKVYLLILVISVNCLISQTVGSSCTAPASITTFYKKSADRMALDYTYKVFDTYVDSLSIHPQRSKRYLNALLAVWNATNLPASDTVTRMVRIDKGKWDVNSFFLSADSNETWMVNLKNNISPTGLNTLDSFVAKYNIAKTNYYKSMYPPNEYNVYFLADSNCNMYKLTGHLSSHQSVKHASPVEFRVVRHPLDITDSTNSQYVELTYSMGWGDCQSGCINKRFWKFRVDTLCNVSYLGSYGQPAPSWVVHLPETGANNQIINIYPNPISDELYIEGIEKNTFQSAELIDVRGQVVMQINQDEILNNQPIQISTLSCGVYLLRVRQNNKLSVFKVLVRK